MSNHESVYEQKHCVELYDIFYSDNPFKEICDKFNYKNKKILDACCGPGYLSHILAKKGAMVTGVDISPSMINFAREKYFHSNIQYFIYDMLQYDDGVFDYIFCMRQAYQEFMTIKEKNILLQRFYSLLSDNGKLFLNIHVFNQCYTDIVNEETKKHSEIVVGNKTYSAVHSVKNIDYMNSTMFYELTFFEFLNGHKTKECLLAGDISFSLKTEFEYMIDTNGFAINDIVANPEPGRAYDLLYILNKR